MKQNSLQGMRCIINGLKTILDFILLIDFPTRRSYIEHVWSTWLRRTGSCFLCLTQFSRFLGKCIVLWNGQIFYGMVMSALWCGFSVIIYQLLQAKLWNCRKLRWDEMPWIPIYRIKGGTLKKCGVFCSFQQLAILIILWNFMVRPEICCMC